MDQACRFKLKAQGPHYLWAILPGQLPLLISAVNLKLCITLETDATIKGRWWGGGRGRADTDHKPI